MDTEYLVLGPDGVSPTGAKALAGSGGSAKADNKACARTAAAPSAI